MRGKKLISFILPLFICAASSAQMDVFTGTWKMEYRQADNLEPITLELRIGAAENNQLYPAQVTLQSATFNGTYNLLLVRKNIRQLAISRNKIPLEELPFTIGNWLVYLNGVFDLSNNKGSHYLTAERLVAKQYGLPMLEVKAFDNKNKAVGLQLNSFIREADIRLKKINSESWQAKDPSEILHAGKTPSYYGIIDSIFTKEKDAVIDFIGSKKTTNGTVSVMLNGSMIIEMANLGYTRPREEVQLDTGMNILVLFTESYGKTPASTGKLRLGFGQKMILMDLGSKDDVAATFIVAKIFYSSPEQQKQKITNEVSGEESRQILPHDTPTNFDSVKQRSGPDQKNFVIKPLPENTLLRDAKLVGSVTVTSKQITLAIWDDAVEDGDSISLSLNGKWVRQGLAVRKKPQFITVTVEPGPNKITFIADNLGSIVPNTSVLEIIDGTERKSFMIDTNLRQNNLIDIFYDNKP
ncbi:MAG: hypothetical protein ABIO04_11315 [Ferruginibacter sp.]